MSQIVPIAKYEREAIRILAGPHLEPELLSHLIEAAEVDSVDHTGVGYFLTISDPRLPKERRTFHEPNVIGRVGSLECGFLCFIGDGELTLECHAYGDSPFPTDIRSRDVHLTIHS